MLRAQTTTTRTSGISFGPGSSHVLTVSIGGATGGVHGPRPPLFCLNIVSSSNTITIGSSDKVNRLMKKTLQNFGSILSILFLTYCYLAVNLAGFRYCLAEYTVHSLSPCYGLLTAFALLNSAARWCNTTPFFKNGVILHACVHGRRKEFFQGGGTNRFLQKFFYGGPKVVKFVFCQSK